MSGDRLGPLRTRRSLRRAAIPFALPLALLLVWEAAGLVGAANPLLYSSPSRVVEAAVTAAGTSRLFGDIASSVTLFVGGLVVGAAVALALGALAARAQALRSHLDALLVLVKAFPTLAVIPVLILVFGATPGVRVGVVALAVFLPIYLETARSLTAMPREALEFARLAGFSKAGVARLRLRYALPDVLTGLRQSIKLAWVGVIGVELYTGADRGIAVMLTVARSYNQVDRVLLGVVLFALFGFLADQLLVLLARRLHASLSALPADLRSARGGSLRESVGARLLSALAVPAALLALWWVTPVETLFGDKLPALPGVVRAAGSLLADGTIASAVLASLQRVLLGLGVSFAAAAAVSVLLLAVPSFSRAVDPMLSLLRITPMISLAPLFLLWFGYGETAAIAVVVGMSFFALYLAVSTALRTTHETFAALRITTGMRWTTYLHAVLAPGSIERIVDGLRYASIIGWGSLTVAEVSTTDAGLGVLVMSSSSSGRPPAELFAAVVAYVVAVVGFDGALRALPHLSRVLRLRHRAPATASSTAATLGRPGRAVDISPERQPS
jgi:sulfonate transport system permease protein